MTNENDNQSPVVNDDSGWESTDRDVLPGLLEHGMAEALLDLLAGDQLL